jgi:hypothetical protein
MVKLNTEYWWKQSDHFGPFYTSAANQSDRFGYLWLRIRIELIDMNPLLSSASQIVNDLELQTRFYDQA